MRGVANIRRRARAIPIPPFIKLGALIALGVAPFIFFVALQSSDNPKEPEQPPTQPVGDQQIPLAFPFGTPEPPTTLEDAGSTTTTSKPPSPSPAQCADGRDNDGDGRTDLADPNCSSRSDRSEAGAVATTRPRPTTTRPIVTTIPPTTTKPATTAPPATTTDDPPGTTSPPATTQPPTTKPKAQGQCSDGIDNDNDGKTDLDDKASCHGDPTDDE